VCAKTGTPAPTEDAIRTHVAQFAEKGVISRYGVPDRVYFVDAIPKTSVGKLDKKVIRAKLGETGGTP
jgi:fatty-acyl-CoA synthase